MNVSHVTASFAHVGTNFEHGLVIVQLHDGTEPLGVSPADAREIARLLVLAADAVEAARGRPS